MRACFVALVSENGSASGREELVFEKSSKCCKRAWHRLGSIFSFGGVLHAMDEVVSSVERHIADEFCKHYAVNTGRGR